MTRKHFVALAEEIKSIDNFTARRIAAEAVARVAKRFNGRFDYDRFMRAARAEFETPTEGKNGR